jgi:hypothetical protein
VENIIDSGHRLLANLRISEVAPLEFNRGKHIAQSRNVTGSQIVDNADLPPISKQPSYQMRTDKAGAAGNKIVDRH